jgi:hypothetical protein
MWWLLFCFCVGGCTITSGLYVEKDWRTDHFLDGEDIQTRWQVEVKKEFAE